jgi:surface protein
MMFNNAYNFKGAPSMANWDTSTIQNFKYMFGYISTPPIGFPLIESFNAPIGSWNLSSAEDLSYMFTRRKAFNQNLNNWNVSKVTNMAYMFAETQAYNQPMNNWNTSKVTNMTFMFHFNPAFNQPLDQWNTSNVINMGHMFHGCSAFNQTINVWNTSKVTDMNTMFTEAQVLTKVYIHGTSRFLLQEIICFIIQASIVKTTAIFFTAGLIIRTPQTMYFYKA